MSNENEPAKLLLPYLQRADELQKHEPLVAYYCRLYAMERGLKIPQSERTKTTSSLLVSLMKQLEKDKKSLQLGPDDHLHLEGFASNVFAKADKQDRAGKADLNTAKTFYAASIFFEILNQFGDMQPDLEQKQKYAAWKAADIRKAIKEGRKPVPGPPGGDKDLSDTSSSGYDLEPSRNEPPPTTGLPPESHPPPQFHERSDSKRFTGSLPSSQQQDFPQPPYVNIQKAPPSSFQPPPSNFEPPPSNFQPPPSNFEPPPSNFQPPPSNFEPPPSNFQPPPSNFEPPPSNFQPPPSNFEPPPSHFEPPPSNFQPPSSTISQPPPPPTYSSDDYPSNNFQQHPSQTYHHQSSYSQEPQHHISQNYPTQDPSFSYPNFQSYPSFSETTLPAVPPHYPSSYYQGSEQPPYSSAPRPTDYPFTSQYNSNAANGPGPAPEPAPAPAPAPPSAQSYQYDSNYQPAPEKIAEAHKAARFAVGALAFDDVFVAVDYLKKSLELLTNPSSSV